MVNYQEGKIYKICCNVTGECYYGSTTQTLAQRMGKHKRNTTNLLGAKAIISRGSFDISLVEVYPCDSKEELHKRERFYIENNSCINKHAKEAWIKEYKEINKEVIKTQRKGYYDANKEKIVTNSKTYYETNKESLTARRKAYNEVNKDKIAARRMSKLAQRDLNMSVYVLLKHTRLYVLY